MKPLDAYATRVAAALRSRGLASSRAIALVQSREEAVWRAFEAGRTPSEVAARIARLEGRSQGRGGGRQTSMARVAAGCSTVPIDAFLYEGSVEDLPRLDRCVGRAPGHVVGGVRTSVPAGASRDALTASVFGRTISAKELEAAFSGTTRDGTPAIAKLTRIWTESRVRANTNRPDFTATFCVKIGAHEGHMTRRFWREEDTITAYHELFDLSEDTPKELGRGVGESITRNSLIWEKQVGVHQVELYASWVGRYVWATFGFDWDGDRFRRDKIVELVNYIKPRFEEVRGSTLQREFDFGRMTRDTATTLAHGVSRHPWDLASLHMAPNHGGDPVHVGKVFLAGIKNPEDSSRYLPGEGGASEWRGVMTLRDGHASWERARRRLGIR